MNSKLKLDKIFDDKYELLEELGSGGIGTVYKALQLDCNRLVALKVLHQYAAEDEEYRSRFLREAQALSKLSHANIVTIYHFGNTSAQVPYLAMEYLNGQSIRAVLNSAGRMPVLQALRIIRDAALALEYTHEQGIVHRDLKPENMILVSTPEPNTLKLVDFGLAKLSSLSNKEQKLTSTGELIGTTAYMSPEQCKGLPVDFRTDIYSLSACLYELMLGQKAMIADNPVGLIYKQINEPVPEIKAAQVDNFDPILNQIISRGMSKLPEKRFASMDEMAHELDLAISRLQSCSKVSIARNRTTFMIAIFAIAAGALALFLLFVPTKSGLSNKTQFSAKGPIVLSTDQDRLSHRIVKLKEKLARWKDTSKIKSHDAQERYLSDLFDLAREQMKSSNKQDIVDAEKTYSDALQFCERGGSVLSKQRIACVVFIAKSQWMQGKYEDADSGYSKAMKLASESHYDDVLQNILGERGLFLMERRRFVDALRDLRQGDELYNKFTGRTGIVELLKNTDTLDKSGDSRSDLFSRHVDELTSMKPDSALEAVQMIELSNQIAEYALLGLHGSEAIQCVRFSNSLLTRCPAESQKELKEQIRILSDRCSEQSRKGTMLR